MLVADGLCVKIGSDFGIEPSARILSTSFSSKSHAPFTETFFQFRVFEPAKVSDFLDAQCVEIRFHDFADAGNLADIEGSQEFGFFAGNDPKNAIGLSLRRGNLRDEPRGSDPNRTVEPDRKSTR